MDRSSAQPGRRMVRADRLLRVALELLSQADDAARAGDAVFLARRLREADRVLRYMPPGDLVKSAKRAKQRSSALRQGEIPRLPSVTPIRIRSAGEDRAAKAIARPGVSPKPKAHKAAKRTQREPNARRQEVNSAAKLKLAADLRRQSCHDCRARGSSKVLTLKSGRPRCKKCHDIWAKRLCPRCGSTWTRQSSADARRRNCPSCRPSGDDYTVSAGAPSLGRRR